MVRKPGGCFEIGGGCINRRKKAEKRSAAASTRDDPFEPRAELRLPAAYSTTGPNATGTSRAPHRLVWLALVEAILLVVLGIMSVVRVLTAEPALTPPGTEPEEGITETSGGRTKRASRPGPPLCFPGVDGPLRRARLLSGSLGCDTMLSLLLGCPIPARHSAKLSGRLTISGSSM